MLDQWHRTFKYCYISCKKGLFFVLKAKLKIVISCFSILTGLYPPPPSFQIKVEKTLWNCDRIPYAKRSLMAWVCIIPKEGLAHMAAPAFFFWYDTGFFRLLFNFFLWNVRVIPKAESRMTQDIKDLLALCSPINKSIVQGSIWVT